MAKKLLPDALWARIAPLLLPEPPKPKGGRPRVSDRAALTGHDAFKYRNRPTAGVGVAGPQHALIEERGAIAD